ncbi:2-isopropylmalate synthase [Alkaliphilus metalliredigens QYMF]|uniref:2-isopropylmalate synthase n=1 Tax=Alkaliphilus metalliredigens (strain QYMF) TaxID=293826 RepID=A6TTR8_ALKMQ|nr:2-isopropylmalate synthase [Alkaliphilus metalliredigens]ABR49586.1 2-isopropylmalate synthase [Alkaliphilus metalliredigens QYMF]
METTRQIKIFDTTLRDGEQSPGCSMNLGEKLEVAMQLEKMKVDVIEAGFAIASPGDFNAVKEIAKIVKNATVASLARALPKDIDRAYEAVKYAENPRIHTFIATSDIHMKYKLKSTEEEVLAQAVAMVKRAKGYCNDVEFSAEDASRSRTEFLYRIFEAVIKAGATVINVPDTVGYTTPDEYYRLIKGIKENVANIHRAEISVHCHNDLGMAVANTLAAAAAGATQLECTINGIGERAGNAALEEIVMGINTRKDLYGMYTNIDTGQIYAASRLTSKVTGMKVQHNKAIVGENAFAHESGIHQHGMLANKSTYEIMTPESIGLSKNQLVLGKHSGSHALEDRLKELGYEISKEKLNEVFKEFKILADRKKVIYDRDLEALVQDQKQNFEEIYQLKEFVINCGNIITSTANIKLIKDGKELEEVAKGFGPIDAAFKAIDNIVGGDFKLEDYSVESVTEGEDALGEAVVKIKRNNEIYNGRGLSTDVVEASIKAYINAINKMMSENIPQGQQAAM